MADYYYEFSADLPMYVLRQTPSINGFIGLKPLLNKSYIYLPKFPTALMLQQNN